MTIIILQLVGVRHKETFIKITIVKIQCDQWPPMLCGKVFAAAFNAFSFGCFLKAYDVTFFLLANVSYAIWKSSQDRVSFNIFPSTHFWLTQNTEISKYLVCQEVSFPGLIDCQYFQNYCNKELKGDSMRWSVTLDFSIFNFVPLQNHYF